jgi:hypothetical protein
MNKNRVFFLTTDKSVKNALIAASDSTTLFEDEIILGILSLLISILI